VNTLFITLERSRLHKCPSNGILAGGQVGIQKALHLGAEPRLSGAGLGEERGAIRRRKRRGFEEDSLNFIPVVECHSWFPSG
jgi:hypothetical protein